MKHQLTINRPIADVDLYYGNCSCGWESDIHYGLLQYVAGEIQEAYKYHS